ncbi:HIL-like protein [Mya arenaria]|uniref:HIL-like protein n=1 Tax=Mya arenaria TaxID=6604 RepID=A0ABY7FRM4_MYAAR|nr:hillarin-like [Mya arenaria]WAR23423.1 HIL-like protein [Mya arenaria]
MSLLKRDWKFIDEHARMATEKDAKSFDSLVAYLNKPIARNPDRDIFMTRALLYWLKCNLEASKAGNHPRDTPLYVAKKMANEEAAYADSFKRFCEKAGIDCHVVEGVAKTGQYKPGDLTVDAEKMRARWNKVFLLGKFWPVNPRYILRSKRRDAEGKIVEGLFNEYWFLTDPEIFIHHCLPTNPEDQMLTVSKRIKNERQFMKLPSLTPAFHDYGLRLTSENQCMIEAIDGLCKVSFKAERNVAKNLVCGFVKADMRRVLDLKGTENKDVTAEFKDIDTALLVFCARKKNNFLFEVRCPVEMAAYNLTIEGGNVGENQKHALVKTRIICREKMEHFKPFPANPGNIGWGFGPLATRVGLKKPSKKDPKFVLNKGSIKIEFEVDADKARKREFTAAMSGEGKSALDLKECAHVTSSSGKLSVEVRAPPTAGEYVLTVLASGEPVCNYLITTLEDAEKLEDEYYDSSDGTSDVDDQIDVLESQLSDLTAKRDRLRALVQQQTGTGRK